MACGDVENPAGVPSSVPPQPPITEEEKAAILNAFRALSPVEMNRLIRYARFRMIPIRERVHHSDAEDLLHEALVKTFDGTRKRNPEISFFYHLVGAMSSIADNWFKRVALTTELPETEPGGPFHSPDSALDAEALIGQIRQALRDKPVALALLDAWMDGNKPAETQRLLNIDDDDYWKARKQITRCAEETVRRNSEKGQRHG